MTIFSYPVDSQGEIIKEWNKRNNDISMRRSLNTDSITNIIEPRLAVSDLSGSVSSGEFVTVRKIVFDYAVGVDYDGLPFYDIIELLTDFLNDVVRDMNTKIVHVELEAPRVDTNHNVNILTLPARVTFHEEKTNG